MYWRRLLYVIVLASALWAHAEPFTIDLTNNQPFPIRMPFEIRGLSLPAVDWGVSDEQWVQQSGSNLLFVADIGPFTNQHLVLREVHARKKSMLRARAIDGALELRFGGESAGTLSWDLMFRMNAKAGSDQTAMTNGMRPDFDRAFQPLPLRFRQIASGGLFEVWSAESEKEGFKLSLELRVFEDGFVDAAARFTNVSAEHTTNVYGAVVCRWAQANASVKRSLCYDNRIATFDENGFSPFRKGGGRHEFIQRGVDWLRTDFAAGATIVWLNDFAPSFTIEAKATARTPSRYHGANLSQLGQEIQVTGANVYSITEIARSNLRSFRDRLQENILPPIGRGVAFKFRMIFSRSQLSNEQVDQMFVGWTSYNEQKATAAGARISFGTRFVRFGTSYFPYSTLGENFDALKLPGMDREGFWPLAADTVTQWRLFADDIRRDLRIAKALGFKLIRLHHVELLAPIDKKTRDEYLDFLFGEFRQLQFKALLDVHWSADQITHLLERHRDVIDSVELENEVLIWGIPTDRPGEWKRVYEAIKRTAPEVKVHLTGYNNTGMFDRLSELGVPYDRVGLHSYIDSTEAIPSGRGYALALSSYASKAGKPPVITEWNCRNLARMTAEARAKIFAPIFENAIGTRGVPDFYEFQFNETLCVNPRVGRGNIQRHYELLNLDRTPKPEAWEFSKLIRKYSDPNDPFSVIDVDFADAHVGSDGSGRVELTIRHHLKEPLRMKVKLETGAGLQAHLVGNVFELPPNGEKHLQADFKIASKEPGFYHLFARCELENGQIRYGWTWVRIQGKPTLDTNTTSEVTYPVGVEEVFRLDFSAPIDVVYANDAPALDFETAFAISQTLEAATGTRVRIFQENDLPAGSYKNLLLVGAAPSDLFAKLRDQLPKSKAFVSRANDQRAENCVIISGSDSQQVEHAGLDFVLRYWKGAKDSAARRVGIVSKQLPRAVDASALP